MDDDDVLLFVYPALGDGFANAEYSIALSENKRWYLPSRRSKPVASLLSRGLHNSRRAREPTAEPEDHDSLDYRACLRLPFSAPKTRHGILFGSNPQSDVVLFHADGVSFNHFAIRCDNDYIYVEDLDSTWGTSVIYGNQNQGRRRKGKWIIGGHRYLKNSGPIVIDVTRFVQFHVVVPIHDTKSQEYRAKVANFHKGGTDADDLECFGELNFKSRPSTQRATGTQTPSTRSIILRRKLGKGSFAIAYHVWNASTGKEYALKEPKDTSYDGEAWAAEASIMRRISHDRIVKFLGFDSSPRPQIRIEFVPGGSISDHLKTHERFSSSECVQVACQGLEALEYLHGLSPVIVHRDLATNNILLEYRHNGRVSIKFADFGLAKEGQQLNTICGNLLYLAPELYTVVKNNPFGTKSKDPYTSAVDIWSMGVVLVDILCCLPQWTKEYQHKDHVWCEMICARLRTYFAKTGDELAPFLLGNMLQIDPRARGSADECHKAALNLSTGSRNGQDALPSGHYEDDDSIRSTIRLGMVDCNSDDYDQPTVKLQGNTSSDIGVSSAGRYITGLPYSGSDVGRSTPPLNTRYASLARKAQVRNLVQKLVDPEDSLFIGSVTVGVEQNFEFDSDSSQASEAPQASDVAGQGGNGIDPAVNGGKASFSPTDAFRDGHGEALDAPIRGIEVGLDSSISACIHALRENMKEWTTTEADKLSQVGHPEFIGGKIHSKPIPYGTDDELNRKRPRLIDVLSLLETTKVPPAPLHLAFADAATEEGLL